ncbi:hypothetical protein Q7P37_008079 [Cladosporium fusiforme]
MLPAAVWILDINGVVMGGFPSFLGASDYASEGGLRVPYSWGRGHIVTIRRRSSPLDRASEPYGPKRSGNGSKQPTFLAVTALLLLTSICVVCARLYCRIKHAKALGLDDGFVVAAMVVAIALGVMNGFHISYGAGTHDPNYLGPGIDPYNAYVPNLKHWYANQIVYPFALALIKMSFLALYNRIFAPPVINRWLLYGTSAFVVIYTVVIMLVFAFECSTPTDAFLPSFPASGDCMDLRKVYFSSAAINILTDLAVLFLPLKPILNLNINTHRKIAVVGIFMVGGFAILASILRVYFLNVYFTSPEPVFATIEIELNAAIICSSIASLRPLFKQFFASTMSRSTGGNNYYNSENIYSPNRSEAYEMHSSVLKSHDGRANTKIEAQLRSMDNDSQELILEKEHADGIRRTVETRILSERVAENDNRQFRGRHSPV